MNRVEKRADLRRRLAAVTHANAVSQRLTSLGMYWMLTSDETPVLVQVEINVPRLLAISAERLFRSKRGAAASGKGSVRISIATPEGQEICARCAMKS